MKQVVYLSIYSVLPALVLCGYIYWRDKVEKEPPLLLLALFGAGAVGFIPAHYISDALSSLLDGQVKNYQTIDVYGIVHYSSGSVEYVHMTLYSFVCIALVSEVIKWTVLFLITRKNKNFNCLYDGIVYSVFVSLGYGLAESLRYAFVDGWDSLLYRFFSLVPYHFFCGVLSGVFYAMWFVLRKAVKAEKKLYADGKITKRYVNAPIIWLSLSIAVPVVVHGFDEFTSSVKSDTANTVKYVLLLALYAVCFFITYHFSKWDGEAPDIANKVILKKHPELKKAVYVEEATITEESDEVARDE